MEDPVREIADAVKALVQNQDIEKQKIAIEKFYHQDATLVHPLVSAIGRYSIEAVYLFRSFVLLMWWAEVPGVWIDEETPLQVVVRLKEHVRPWYRFWASSTYSSLHIIDLVEVSYGTTVVKKIFTHSYHIESETLAQETPFLGSFYDLYIDLGVAGFFLRLLAPLLALFDYALSLPWQITKSLDGETKVSYE